MKVPDNLLYTTEHEWARISEKAAVVGITDYAQAELGDVVFVDLPELGKELKKGDTLLTVESVKAVSDVYAPVSGRVVEVNEQLSNTPELVNAEPYDKGWMVAMELVGDETSELLSSEKYSELMAEIAK